MKLMIDTIEGLRIIASGSSAFELNNQIGEPLVGRMYTFQMFPLSQGEFSVVENLVETRKSGGYPEFAESRGRLFLAYPYATGNRPDGRRKRDTKSI